MHPFSGSLLFPVESNASSLANHWSTAGWHSIHPGAAFVMAGNVPKHILRIHGGCPGGTLIGALKASRAWGGSVSPWSSAVMEPGMEAQGSWVKPHVHSTEAARFLVNLSCGEGEVHIKNRGEK